MVQGLLYNIVDRRVPGAVGGAESLWSRDYFLIEASYVEAVAGSGRNPFGAGTIF